jgi:glycosyltransferase involved in cell wall biosynthesis
MTRRRSVLLSAYACRPGAGSEPAIGWNVALEVAKHHDVWVLTRASHRSAIEATLATAPVAHLRFVYYDLPTWARWWKRGGRGVTAYAYLWQLGIQGVARRLQQEVGFDVAHHVTFARYWAPSGVASLGIPFVWGPVGGGESAQTAFRSRSGARGRGFEGLRDVARWAGERDPLVRRTAQQSRVALATTDATAARMRALGAHDVRTRPAVALSLEELERQQRPEPRTGVRFVSVGRLVAWKAFDLGLEAFAAAALPDAEYWVVGNGPQRGRLEALAAALGVTDRVRFLGALPRDATLARIRSATALVHPSLHDSGGFVCLEAMAAGTPVVCLDVGGPGALVTDEAGVKVAADDPVRAIGAMAEAMRRLADDDEYRGRLGAAGRRRVQEAFTWAGHAQNLIACYETAIERAHREGDVRALRRSS